MERSRLDLGVLDERWPNAQKSAIAIPAAGRAAAHILVAYLEVRSAYEVSEAGRVRHEWAG